MLGKLVRLILPALALACAAQGSANPADTKSAIDLAIRDMCDKDLVVLGEASHGDGATAALKAQLVTRLIERCGFSTLAWEAGHYEFANIADRRRLGQKIDAAGVGTAAGAFWSRNAELQTFFGFLAARINAGKLRMAGLDDQPFGRNQTYVSSTLAGDLAVALPADQRSRCEPAFRTLLDWKAEKSAITEGLICLAQVETAAANLPNPVPQGTVQSAAGLRRYFARQGLQGPAALMARDASMFLNLQALRATCPGKCKVIVWTHNVHAARTALSFPEFGGGSNLGALSAAVLPRSRSYALAFTALAGNYRWTFNDPPRVLEPALPGSLESLGSASAITYLPRNCLLALGVVPARLRQHESYLSTNWGEVFDGVMILDREAAPQLVQ